MSDKQVYDMVILGGGPSGLTSLIYAVRGGVNAILIEENPYGCGQISLTDRVDNYPGLYGTIGYDLGEKFIEHATSLGGTIKKGKIVKIEKRNELFVSITEKGEEYISKTLIYALGAHHKTLNIPGEDKFKARGVSYCATCDATFFKDKDVAVIGGGDTALGDAIVLSKLSHKVYIIHRRDEFRASKSLVNKCKEVKNIEFVFNTIPIEILGDKSITGVKCQDKTINVDGVFVAIGEAPNGTLLNDFVSFDGSGHIITNNDCETQTKGLFAVGDVRSKRLRQVLTAASDGAVASTFAIEEYC